MVKKTTMKVHDETNVGWATQVLPGRVTERVSVGGRGACETLLSKNYLRSRPHLQEAPPPPLSLLLSPPGEPGASVSAGLAWCGQGL